MIAGLTLPRLSAYDPPMAGEGTLYPLGLGSLADKLADEIAPWLTARMSRIRFVTAIAAAARVLEGLGDEVATDGVTPPYLIFEWLLVEAIARDGNLPSSATQRVPGIDKARRVWARGGHLDALSYLKTPKVFGFHGVYRRLAVDMGVVDRNGYLGERGDELLRAWEREQAYPGFADRLSGSNGGKFAKQIEREIISALRAGILKTGHRSWIWSKLARTFRPDDAGPRERALLLEWLLDPGQPLQREFFSLILDNGPGGDEAGAIRAVRPQASEELGRRLDAIEAYEAVAVRLRAALDVLRRASTASGARPIEPDALAGHGLLTSISADLPSRLEKASSCLEGLQYDALFETTVGMFREVSSPADLVEMLLERHRIVQASKPPVGKRPWFDEFSDGFAVRIPYRLAEPPELSDSYLHPYRVYAIRYFLGDLQ